MLQDPVLRSAPDYVEDVLREHARVSLTELRRASTPRSTKEPIVYSVIRNEADRLEEFLRHYRGAGVERFCFIDNGSGDGGLEFLLDQPDCDVHQIVGPFEWRKKHGWITLAIDMAGRGRDEWHLYADADEHFVFDGFGDRSFRELAERMERKGVTRVRAMLVDMYQDGPLLETAYVPGQRLIEAYPWFDAAGYDERVFREIVSRKGGPRQRVFGPASEQFRPEMTKYPLFKLSGRDVFANPHHVWPYEENFKSECMIGILHFKFLPDTLKRIDRAVSQENYWGGSIEYKCYKEILSKNPKLSLVGDVSRRYGSPASLLDAGLIAPVSW
jgi:hypothetical protein